MSPRVTPKNRIPDIVSAAVTVFSRRGFRLTQMDEIAREANVSKATLYYYFKNKNHLFQYILENVEIEDGENLPAPETVPSLSEEELLQSLKDRLKEGSRVRAIDRFLRKRTGDIDLEGELTEILGQMMDILEKNRIPIVILEKSAYEFPELAEVYDKYARRQALRQFEKYLTSRVQLGVVRPLNSAALTARLILESLAWFGFKQPRVTSLPLYPKAEILPDFVALLFHGLKA